MKCNVLDEYTLETTVLSFLLAQAFFRNSHSYLLSSFWHASWAEVSDTAHVVRVKWCEEFDVGVLHNEAPFELLCLKL